MQILSDSFFGQFLRRRTSMHVMTQTERYCNRIMSTILHSMIWVDVWVSYTKIQTKGMYRKTNYFLFRIAYIFMTVFPSTLETATYQYCCICIVVQTKRWTEEYHSCGFFTCTSHKHHCTSIWVFVFKWNLCKIIRNSMRLHVHLYSM